MFLLPTHKTKIWNTRIDKNVGEQALSNAVSKCAKILSLFKWQLSKIY